MTAFDWIALGIVALSLVVGLFRGFMREIFSLAGWIVAGVVAAAFAEEAATYLPPAVDGPLLRWGLAFIVLFIAVLILSGLVSLLVRRLMRAAGLGAADRMFGAVFGAVRGVAALVVFVLLAGLTPLRDEAFWKDSQVIPPLETAAAWVKPFLPDAVRDRLRPA
jgi:membrane protein required for colicin V production